MRLRQSRNSTPDEIAERIELGRGLGIGDEYQPYLDVHDFRSRGVRVRAWWWKTNRIHHFFSILEYWLFLLFAVEPNVVDIREQFPLLDFKRVREASVRCRNENPRSKAGTTGRVLTTDMLVTRNIDGVLQDTPYTVKWRRETLSNVFHNRYRVEEIYWESNPAPLKLLTEVDAPLSRVRSADWLLEATHPFFLCELAEDSRLGIAADLAQAIAKPHENLAGVCATYDQKVGYAPGTSIDVSRWMLVQGRWNTRRGTAPYPAEPLTLVT